MKKNILLVEYDDSSIETIKEALSQPTFNITIGKDGEAAKKLLKDKTQIAKFDTEKIPVLKKIKNYDKESLIKFSGLRMNALGSVANLLFYRVQSYKNNWLEIEAYKFATKEASE